jgi:hypothetical protein
MKVGLQSQISLRLAKTSECCLIESSVSEMEF